MMTTEEALEYYRKSGAILKGHFRLTSGRHADTYMQSAKVFVDPACSEKLCAALVEKLNAAGVVAPVALPNLRGLRKVEVYRAVERHRLKMHVSVVVGREPEVDALVYRKTRHKAVLVVYVRTYRAHTVWREYVILVFHVFVFLFISNYTPPPLGRLSYPSHTSACRNQRAPTAVLSQP